MSLSDLKLDQATIVVQIAALVYAISSCSKLLAEANKSFKLFTTWLAKQRAVKAPNKKLPASKTLSSTPSETPPLHDSRPESSRDFYIVLVVCSGVLVSQVFVSPTLSTGSAAVSVMAGATLVIAYIGKTALRLMYAIYSAERALSEMLLLSTKVSLEAIRLTSEDLDQASSTNDAEEA